ncbi:MULTISPECIES: LacI family DNA-binding transcriptional regulator [unclassified Microbacterium]|uniref:LacI family DNA-binding transcriptional regulator n=1 Tax=unclassified Microbacterium TaxID=2609290 RepID=UPI000EA91BC5|nr:MULTISPECIES: LacI family DNA-binding transcriptional regulator [unclassified Microbacterium]MBT2483519.1 LacI family DNA-binding transcriptional regulator [Microbacterium sp. ISL-108]RKN69401.1 LacI family transcriptional regulator [Microbacterium sp. CGR2]
MARVTLQTVADEVGVSRMTVSNAFSRPDQLSAELRERILKTAERLNYSGPDPSARALARGRTGVIGMLLTESPRDAFTDDVAVGFVGAVAGELADAGYSLVLLHTESRSGVVPVRDVAMDAAIIFSCTPRSAEVSMLLERQIPLVSVEGTPIEGVPLVQIDDEGGAYAAAKHIAELGHADVVLVVTTVDVDDELLEPSHIAEAEPTIAGRLTGWGRALTEAGLRPRVVGTPTSTIDDTLRARMGRMLDHPPSAVLTFSDLAAIEVIDQAAARGISVPDDLSVAGFDDNPLAARVSPALTTVRQDTHGKGVAAASVLLALLDGREAPARQSLPTELVVRDSTRGRLAASLHSPRLAD